MNLPSTTRPLVVLRMITLIAVDSVTAFLYTAILITIPEAVRTHVLRLLAANTMHNSKAFGQFEL